MPAVCVEHISGICCVTVSFLQSYSIFHAMGRALCSCQATRISAPLLPAESGSEPRVPGTGGSVQIFFPVWNRFTCWSEYTWAVYPHSGTCMEERGCCSSILSAGVISWVLVTWTISWAVCAYVQWSQGYWCKECWDTCSSLAHPMISVRLCEPRGLYLGEESQPFLFLSLIQFPCLNCVFCPLSGGKGADMCFFISKDHWTDAALNIKASEMVYVAKQ